MRLRCALQVFRGNSNTYIAEVRAISPPIIARRFRIVPQSSYPRTVCMRVELYGCLWRGACPWLSAYRSTSQQVTAAVNAYGALSDRRGWLADNVLITAYNLARNNNNNYNNNNSEFI